MNIIKFIVYLTIPLSGLWLVACSDSGAVTDEDSETTTGTGEGEGEGEEDTDSLDDIQVNWEPCSLHEGQDDGLAECALVEMPLRWEEPSAEAEEPSAEAEEPSAEANEPNDEIFTTRTKRLLSHASNVDGQLWLLHGGPGASGTVGLPGLMEILQGLYPQLDLYTLDPRGAGPSQWLGCPEQEASTSDQGSWISQSEIDDCIEYVQATYGDKLDVFNATHAALDLAALIHNTKQDDKKVFIWGGSGGTFWAQRYLQFYPDQVDGVIIEGIVPPDGSLVYQDEHDDLIARKIIELCSLDDYCSSKLPDPQATLLALFDKLDGGHCASLGIDASGVKSFIRGMNYYSPTNQFMPGFIYRMDRCNQDDQQAIYNFYSLMWGQPEEPYSMSTVLFFNEGLSELWEYKDFATNKDLLSYLDDVHESGLITNGLGYDRNDYYLKWPKYKDKYDNTWAESDVPMLMLQGQLDPSTPHVYAETVGQHFNGPNQNWVSFPYSTHNVASGSPTSSNTFDTNCGYRLFVNFMKNPTSNLDTSCVDQTLPLDFEGTSWAPSLLGTNDFFENDPPSSNATNANDAETRQLNYTLRLLGQKLGHLRQIREIFIPQAAKQKLQN